MDDDFQSSGLTGVTTIDWENLEHKRIVMACCTQAVSVEERDRQVNRTGELALAPPWYKSFGFEISSQLVNDADDSIFGIIYVLNSLGVSGNPPKYVVAFRGTMFKGDTWYDDVRSDMELTLHNLKHNTRAQTAINVVRDLVDRSRNETPPNNIWLTGHSLGAAFARLAGWEMKTKRGICLQTYLFNPPFVSLIPSQSKFQFMNKFPRLPVSFVKYGIAKVKQHRMTQIKDLVDKLSGWEPFVFVHPRDCISAEYIYYMENRERLKRIGAEAIELVASQISFGNEFFRWKNNDDNLEASHLLPSLFLAINRDNFRNRRKIRTFLHAHSLKQWWTQNLPLEFKSCRKDLNHHGDTDSYQ